ncbi:methyltransferase domain-containing protein [Myxococcota bacterium]|nr:methyltransferase domain-containing protein [Myxococcota bacterium]MBU1432855.1 methyltransferase domain-containing protein [Myxococcota bacterium]MBU1898032.1 methyltransferase domain-containing protein [Myxococcota bacterium]
MAQESGFSIQFNENDQVVTLAGVLRPESALAGAEVVRGLREAAAVVRGRLYINLKRLEQMSYLGHRVFTSAVRAVLDAHPDIEVILVTSSVVPWANRRFAPIAARWPRLRVEQYDQAFYPGQRVIESDGLLPVLRAQTSVIWRHEREMLSRHGLKPGAAVADICCGIGDFAMLLWRNFAPSRIVAVDHYRPFLDYARSVAGEFGAEDIEYQYGDAASLFLADETFDFVTSRLALQIFDKPAQIISELKRICRPGGRVYVTNEMMGHIYAYPKEEPVTWAYRLIPQMAASLGMDVNFGPKARAYLEDAGLVDIRVDLLEVNNVNSDLRDFAAVAAGWRDYVVDEVAIATGQPPEVVERLRSALEDFLYVVENRRGFAAWPIYVASGQKPQ